jgi:hypothetical protein
MVEDLKTFVAADLPFKKVERSARLKRSTASCPNRTSPPAEQYRLIMEAYQAEMEYGRTISTWQEEIDIDGNPTTVDMFLYGRVALVYLTPNGKASPATTAPPVPGKRFRASMCPISRKPSALLRPRRSRLSCSLRSRSSRSSKARLRELRGKP